MEVWKIIFLSKWVICRFHVNLPGCKPKSCWRFRLASTSMAIGLWRCVETMSKYKIHGDSWNNRYHCNIIHESCKRESRERKKTQHETSRISYIPSLFLYRLESRWLATPMNWFIMAETLVTFPPWDVQSNPPQCLSRFFKWKTTWWNDLEIGNLWTGKTKKIYIYNI